MFFTVKIILSVCKMYTNTFLSNYVTIILFFLLLQFIFKDVCVTFHDIIKNFKILQIVLLLRLNI